MKKTYFTPATVVVAIATDTILAPASQNITSNDNDILYGGIDENGAQVPGTRRRKDIWDDEEEYEEML